MTRLWISALLTGLGLLGALAAQNPIDPTGTSLHGLTLFNNPDCNDVPRSWRWPLPPNACYRASVLGILGERELTPAVRPFSFVTGHTDPVTGREFALLSAWNGLVIVDAHDISNTGPTRRTPDYWFLADNTPAVHRGTASFGEYVYETNAFRPSIRVTRVSVVTTPGTSITVTPLPDVPLPPAGASYRLTVDQERGHLYVPGLSGLYIYDVNGPNGAAPQLLAVWKGWLGGGGTIPSFDVHLQRDGGTVRAVVSEYLTQGVTHIAILDVTNLPAGLPPVDPWTPPNWCAFQASLPGSGNAHSAWMSADGDYLYSSIGDVATIVYDMRGFTSYNSNSVVSIAQIPPRVPHAAFPTADLRYPEPPLRHMGMLGLGYAGYVSAWQEGLILYDIRPGNLQPNQILAQVDTSFASSSQPYGGPTWSNLYPGAFATYRAQDSGVIYVSDDENGLFLVRLNVGHMHRFGAGTGEQYNGDWLIPRISSKSAPPREHLPNNPDPDQRITISNLVPGRAVLVLAATDGRRDGGIPFPTATSTCLNHLGGVISQPIFLTANAAGEAELALPPVLPEQFRLFVQAWSFLPSTTTCVASSRGTWFGLAARR
ncbi:MAG: hypothetical protein NXI31_22880 [bacterium]|nr:hypothetical protein [bacterium]